MNLEAIETAPSPLPSPLKRGEGAEGERGEHTECLCLIIVLADTPYSFINFEGQPKRTILGA
jgi:hypothetical protein